MNNRVEGKSSFRSRYIKDILYILALLIVLSSKSCPCAEMHAHTGSSVSTHRQNQTGGLCMSEISNALQAMLSTPAVADPMNNAAELVYRSASEKGDLFFRTENNAAKIVSGGRIIPINAKNPVFRSWLYQRTSMTASERHGKALAERLEAITLQAGTLIREKQTFHSERNSFEVYYHLHNDKGEVLHLTPTGIEVVKNGQNNIVIVPSPNIMPITFIPMEDTRAATDLLQRVIINSFAASPLDKRLLLMMLHAFPLVDYVGSKPYFFFEGPSGVGKSMASKLLSMLIYGNSEEVFSIDANSGFEYLHRNPVLLIDNIETKDDKAALRKLFLFASTGTVGGAAANAKSAKPGRPRGFLAVNGIDCLGEELIEYLNRMANIRFDTEFRHSHSVDESELLALTERHRDEILSAIFIKAQATLKQLAENQKAAVLKEIGAVAGNHVKSRCDEFYAISLIATHADSTASMGATAPIDAMKHLFDIIENQDTNLLQKHREANPVIAALVEIFQLYNGTEQNAQRQKSLNSTFKINVLVHADEFIIMEATAADLFYALRAAAERIKVDLPFKNARSLGKTIIKTLDGIDHFEIVTKSKGSNVRAYDIVANREIIEKYVPVNGTSTW